MNLTKRSATREDVATVASRIKAIDHELIGIVAKTDCLAHKAAGQLVAMQRQLRRLRAEIEVEAGLWD